MKCPYCGEELTEDVYYNGVFQKQGCDDEGVYLWDEYLCKCSECGKEFYWYENYMKIEPTVYRMESEGITPHKKESERNGRD